MHQKQKAMIAVAIMLSLATPVWAQSSSSRKKPVQARTPVTAQRAANTGSGGTATGDGARAPEPARSAVSDPSYVIGAQDIIDVSVWKEPELSVRVPVRPDGKISLPLIDDIQAAGETPTGLAAHIAVKLKQYVAEPRVTVIVTEINSQRFYVLGEVPRPGAFPLLPNMTVLQAISTAGGFNQFASPSKTYVLRNVDGKQVKLPFNYKKVVAGGNPEQNIELRPGDTIVVP